MHSSIHPSTRPLLFPHSHRCVCVCVCVCEEQSNETCLLYYRFAYGHIHTGLFIHFMLFGVGSGPHCAIDVLEPLSAQTDVFMVVLEILYFILATAFLPSSHHQGHCLVRNTTSMLIQRPARVCILWEGFVARGLPGLRALSVVRRVGVFSSLVIEATLHPNHLFKMSPRTATTRNSSCCFCGEN